MTSPVCAVEAIEKAMEGVTPGEWVAHQTVIHGRAYGGHWVEVANEDQLIQISGSGGARSFTQRVFDTQDHDDNEANARYVAACNPVAMREVLDELYTLRKAVGKDAREFMQSLVDDASRYNALRKESARQAEALQRENAEKDAEIAKLREVLVDVPAVEPVAGYRRRLPQYTFEHYEFEQPGYESPSISDWEPLYTSPPLSHRREGSAEVERLRGLLDVALDALDSYADPTGYTDSNGEQLPLDEEVHQGLLASETAGGIRAALAATRSGSAPEAKGCAE